MEDLEQIIADLLERRDAAPEGSAAYRMAIRQLLGLRRTRENACPIMEDLDAIGWGAMTFVILPPAEFPADNSTCA